MAEQKKAPKPAATRGYLVFMSKDGKSWSAVTPLGGATAFVATTPKAAKQAAIKSLGSAPDSAHWAAVPTRSWHAQKRDVKTVQKELWS